MALPTQADWIAHFDDIPPAFHRLLAELLQEVQAEREHELGIERRGRRPALAVGSMDDVVNLAYSQRSNLPFPEALRAATAQAPSTVARMAKMNPGNLHRIMAGREPLTKGKIEAIAQAIHVNPGYFHEYRVLVIHEAIDGLLNPHRSLQAYAAIEPAHYQKPAPKTPNAVNGYAVSARLGSKTYASRAKRVDGPRT